MILPSYDPTNVILSETAKGRRSEGPQTENSQQITEIEMKTTIQIVAVLAIVLLPLRVIGQQSISWRSEAANGNWENGHCGEIGFGNSQWWYPGFAPNQARNRPDCNDGSTTRHNLSINNNAHLTMTLNTTFWGVRSLTLTSATLSNRTFNGSADDATRGLSLTNGLFNDANNGVTHTFNVRIGIDAASVTLRTLTSGATTTFTREIFGNSNTIVFDGSGTTNVNAVISGTGASITKSGSGTLSLTSNNTYTGNTNINGGVLSSSGNLTSSLVTVNDGGSLSITATTVSVNGLTVNSGGTLTIGSGRTLTVNGTLTVANGANISNDDWARIIIGSSGSISTSTPSAVVSAATFAREITGGAGWRLLSVPKSGFTVANLAAQTGVQGVTGGANSGFNSNLFTGYTTTTDAWVSAANHTDEFAAGRGFALYFFNNNNAGSSVLPVTLTASGSNLSDAKPVLSAGGAGFNLIGNPYGHAIDVRKLVGRGATVPSVLQIWDDSGVATTDANGNTGSWISTSTQSHILGVWQGGFIQNSNSATDVFIPNAAKLNEPGGFFKETESEERFITLRLDGHHASTGVHTVDRASTLYFHETATLGWDQWDASKIRPLTPSTATIGYMGERNGELTLQSQYSLPYDHSDIIEIPMDFQVSNMGGAFELSADQLVGLPTEWSVLIRDNQTGAVVDLRSDTYSFEHQMLAKIAPATVEPSAIKMSAASSPRFTLIIDPHGITLSTKDDGRGTLDEFALLQNYPNPFNPSTQIGFTLRASHLARLTVYDILGREVAVLVNGVMPAGSHTATFDASNLTSGVYIYKLEAGGQVMTKRMTLIK